MMNKKAIAGFETVLLILSMFAFAFMVADVTPSVAAQSELSEPSTCCEKTEDGAWCVNADESDCSDSFLSAPTSCETTSYCRLGTCYESEEGICMENTPQRVCNAQGGTWDDREIGQVPQCQLGCCIIADQAAFVPLVRCKRLSTFFGVANDYRTGITNEVDCIATAQAQDTGACVYEEDFDRVCQFTTRGECGASDKVESVNGTNVSLSSQRTFYKDFLCSAEELNTACAKQTNTVCYQGDVFWTDSCGNRENVYSEDKARSWNNGKKLDADGVCDPNDGSDMSCGNCDYFLGSRCAEFEGYLGGPETGDNYCQRTECVDRNGDARINGESWCVYDDGAGNGGDTVGSRYYREVCVDGDVRVEPCADFRNEVCYQDSVETDAGDFQTSGCRVNRWQECVAQEDEDDCTNNDKRDCIWLPAVTGMVIGGAEQQGDKFSNPTGGTPGFSNPTSSGEFEGGISPVTGQAIFGGDDEEEEVEEETVTNRPSGVCVPNFAPGLNFWEESTAQQTCGQANAKCVVVFEEGLIGGSDCVEGCECLEEPWALDANRVCASLGDCGGYVNYKGTYTDDGYKWLVDEEDKKFAPNTVNIISGGFTGMVAAVTGMVVGTITGEATKDTKKSKGSSIGGVVQAATAVAPMKDLFDKGIFGSNGPSDLQRAASNQGAGPVSQSGAEEYFGVTRNSASGPTVAPNLAGSKTPVFTRTPSGESSMWAGNQLYDLKGTFQAGSSYSGVTGQLGNTALKDATVAFSKTDSGGYLAKITQDGKTFTEAFDALPDAEGMTQMQAGEPGSTLSGWLGAGGGGIADALIGGLQWAAIAYGAGMLIGNLLGMEENNVQALSTALAAGAFAYKAVATYEAFGSVAAYAPVIGIGVAAIVFVMMYRTTETQVVEFNCMPWQAPSGGDVCEECNDDTLPCSEYRCKALGQNCELENVGTDNEICVNVRPNDVVPPMIKPNYEDLSRGHDYTGVKNSPPGPGFTITNMNASDGCLKAFTPLEFGIALDEPGQCKIDFNHTVTFDDMRAYVGGSNLYSYNHSETFSLPSAADLQNSSLVLENGKDMTFFLRCKDKNGNENEAEYAVKFCVDPTPDSTAPKVEATSVLNGGCVAEDQDTANVKFYTNEPAECRWSPQDQDFDNMQGLMSCNNELYQANAEQLFTCATELTGISRDDTKFYIRCKDHAGNAENERNEMAQSYAFSLRGSTGLKMKNLRPNETIFGAVSPMPVELYVETLFGCNDGRAICSYSETGDENDYIAFFDTNTEDGIHTQRLDLTEGDKEYYVKCVDEGGNLVVDTADFELDIDQNAPVVARIYEESNMLKLVTVRDSECAYTYDDCDFSFDEGTQMPYANTSVHVAEWNNEETFYIKCRDEFRNEDADCSVIVRPSRNFL